MIFEGHTSEQNLKYLREKFEQVNKRSSSLNPNQKYKKTSKWIETCRIIENRVPDYLLKRLQNYY